MKGKINISRPSGFGPARIVIELEDAASGCRFFRGEMRLADFTLALTQRGDVPIRFKVNKKAVRMIGTIREVKQEAIAIADTGSRADFLRNGQAAIKALEVDGWIGERADLQNYHNRRQGKVKPGETLWVVRFTRWIPKSKKAKGAKP